MILLVLVILKKICRSIIIDVVDGFCNTWRLRASVIKCAVMVFSRRGVWGEHKLPNVSSYTYLGIEFSSNGAWDSHVNKVLSTGM